MGQQFGVERCSAVESSSLPSAGSSRPLGVTVDVESAHRIPVVRPEDWPRQAWQVRPGGVVFLNRRGTFGIASAAYWWGRLAAALQRSALMVLGPLSAVVVVTFRRRL